LTLVAGSAREVVERIGDRGLAIEMAQRIRHATGRTDAPASPAPAAPYPPTSPPAPAMPPPPPPPPAP
jgi:hypothetical protein